MENNNGIVRKSNYLIEAPSRLTLTEQKIVYLILSMIKKEDEDFKKYDFPVKEFMEILDLKGQSAYGQLKSATRLLRSRTFSVKYKDENGNKHELITGWVSDADYNDDEGKVSFYLSHKLKPFLLQLKGQFTILELEELMQFNSIYSTKLYELLKQYIKIGNREFELEDLREKLNATKKTYSAYSAFKQKIIIPSQQEINEKTNIWFDFKEIKEGRKVVGIEFEIHSKNENQETKNENDKTPDADPVPVIEGQISVDEFLEENSKLIVEAMMITEEELSMSAIRTLLNIANNDLELIRKKFNLSKQEKKIRDLGKWMYAAIKEDYKKENGIENNKKAPEENKGNKYKNDKPTFKNFKERDYDPIILKEKLLKKSGENL